MTTDDLTQQGIAALKSGDKAQARKLLVEAVQQNPQNQVALLWLAGTLDNLDNQRRCLERAIAIDPDSHSGKLAARGLQQLTAREQPEPVAATPAPPQPAIHHETPPTEAPAAPVETGPSHEDVTEAPFARAEAQPHEEAQPQATPHFAPVSEIQPLSSASVQLTPAGEIQPLSSASASTSDTPSTFPPPISPPPPSATPYASGGEKKRSTPTWVWVVSALALIALVPCFCIGTVGVLTLLGNRVTEVPPSLPITDLVPFTHEETGITGMRPENWEIFSGEDYFEVSSSQDAPDDFTAWIMLPDEFPDGGITQASRDFLDSFKENYAEGPPPEILEENVFDDGSGTLLVSYTDTDWTETTVMRFTAYARTQPVAQGLLVAFVIVPAEQFPDQEGNIRTMIDSLNVQ